MYSTTWEMQQFCRLTFFWALLATHQHLLLQTLPKFTADLAN